jgi:DnaK suppressor protein
MTEKDLQYFKDILEAKHDSSAQDLGKIKNQSLNTTSAESSGDLTYSDHMPDLGSATMEREKAFMFASRDGVYLDQVEAALTRIESRTFGICRSCGCEIPRARLEAVPTTQVCVPCKESKNGHTAKPA